MTKTLQYVAVSPDGENDDRGRRRQSRHRRRRARHPRPRWRDRESQPARIDRRLRHQQRSVDGWAVCPSRTPAGLSPRWARQGRVTFAAPLQFYAGAYEPTPGTLIAFKRDYAPVCPTSRVDVTRDASIVAVRLQRPQRRYADVRGHREPPRRQSRSGSTRPAAGIFYNPFGGFIGADSFKFRASATPRLARARRSRSTSRRPARRRRRRGAAERSVQPAGIDNDKDGFFAGQDCNDGNAAIRPGAVEVKGNRLDENCDGLAEPFPTLTSGVASKWDVKGNSLTLTLLQVTQQFPKGWKVVIKCSGKPKCSFRTQVAEGRQGQQGRVDGHPLAEQEAAEVPSRTNGRGVGERAQLQHEGRPAGAAQGQDPDDAAVLRAPGTDEAAEDLLVAPGSAPDRQPRLDGAKSGV